MKPDDVRRLRQRHLDRIQRCSVLQTTPGCPHEQWKKYDDQFASCRKCGLIKAYRIGDPPELDALPAILKGRKLPPMPKTNGDGFDVVLGDRLKLHCLVFHDWQARDLYSLKVRFPKGWASTCVFHELEWGDIRKVWRRVKNESPYTIYKAIQLAVYGRCHRSAVRHLMHEETT